MPLAPRLPQKPVVTAGYDAEVSPATGPITGVCDVPGSKSLTVRALLLAGFAHGTSELTGLLDSNDAFWARDVLSRLGIKTAHTGDRYDALVVLGCGGMPPMAQATLHLGDAGTLARFLPGMLAAAPAGHWSVTGSAQLTRRPLAPLVKALQDMRAKVVASTEGGLPLQIEGGALSDGMVRLAGHISSQFVSGALMAAAASGRAFDVQVEGALVQPAYVDMTVRYLQMFGAQVSCNNAQNAWRIGPSKLMGRCFTVEADASTACYFWALAAATGGQLTVGNVGRSSTQADIGLLPFLERMGCAVTQTDQTTTVVGPKQLKGGFEANLNAISDQTPTLAALAALADAPINIVGVGHIRHHESDRLIAMAQALQSVGAGAEVHATGLYITPQARHAAVINSHNDHRIAMSMALVAVKTPGVRIQHAECVAKTCPQFFEMLEAFGLGVRRWSAADA